MTKVLAVPFWVVAFRLWLQTYTIGWEILLPMAVVLAVLENVADEREKSWAVPWLFLLAWVIAGLLFYVTSGAHALYGAHRARWAIFVAAIAVATFVPAAAVTVMTSLPGLRRVSVRWRAALAAFAGILSIPIAVAAASSVADWLFPLMGGAG